MHIVKLTSAESGRTLYVNLAATNVFFRDGDKTKVTFSDGDRFVLVTETPEEIYSTLPWGSFS